MGRVCGAWNRARNAACNKRMKKRTSRPTRIPRTIRSRCIAPPMRASSPRHRTYTTTGRAWLRYGYGGPSRSACTYGAATACHQRRACPPHSLDRPSPLWGHNRIQTCQVLVDGRLALHPPAYPDGVNLLPNTISLRPASSQERGVLDNLVQLYCHDWSELVPLDVGPDGRFGGLALEPYWSDDWRRPCLIQVAET